MRAEAVSAFVVIFCGLVVVKYPATVLGPARLVHQVAKLITLAF